MRIAEELGSKAGAEATEVEEGPPPPPSPASVLSLNIAIEH